MLANVGLISLELMLCYCRQCWSLLPIGSQVCPVCGSRVEDSQSDIVDKYIAALRHPQAETRLRAAWMLGRLRAANAISALREIVAARRNGDPYLLSAAVQSLGQIDDDRAVRVLLDLLADRSAAFMARVQAVHALSQIGGDQAQAALLAAASDPNARVREAVAAALRRVSKKRD